MHILLGNADEERHLEAMCYGPWSMAEHHIQDYPGRDTVLPMTALERGDDGVGAIGCDDGALSRPADDGDVKRRTREQCPRPVL